MYQYAMQIFMIVPVYQVIAYYFDENAGLLVEQTALTLGWPRRLWTKELYTVTWYENGTERSEKRSPSWRNFASLTQIDPCTTYRGVAFSIGHDGSLRQLVDTSFKVYRKPRRPTLTPVDRTLLVDWTDSNTCSPSRYLVQLNGGSGQIEERILSGRETITQFTLPTTCRPVDICISAMFSSGENETTCIAYPGRTPGKPYAVKAVIKHRELELDWKSGATCNPLGYSFHIQKDQLINEVFQMHPILTSATIPLPDGCPPCLLFVNALYDNLRIIQWDPIWLLTDMENNPSDDSYSFGEQDNISELTSNETSVKLQILEIPVHVNHNGHQVVKLKLNDAFECPALFYRIKLNYHLTTKGIGPYTWNGSVCWKLPIQQRASYDLIITGRLTNARNFSSSIVYLEGAKHKPKVWYICPKESNVELPVETKVSEYVKKYM